MAPVKYIFCDRDKRPLPIYLQEDIDPSWREPFQSLVQACLFPSRKKTLRRLLDLLSRTMEGMVRGLNLNFFR